MALSPRTESRLKHQSTERIKQTSDPVEKLRLRCLARGANGIRGLGRAFRIVDNDGDRSLSQQEFLAGVQDFGLMISKEEALQVFHVFDRNMTGSIDFDEFLEALRPPMSERRKHLIELAFGKLDRNGEGRITVSGLRGIYNVRKHHKYLNGEWTEDQCLREFLDSFDIRGNRDGMVTKDEFLNYYSAVSASIDSDPYFDLMMRNSYGLSE